MKKIFHKHTSDDTSDGGKEGEEEGGEKSARFALDPVTSPAKKKQGKKEVRVQEPASEDGEEKKAKLTSVKKAHKTAPPPVSGRKEGWRVRGRDGGRG